MAKRKRRRSKFRAAKVGKRTHCRTFVAANCAVKIGGRRYKAKSGCPTGKVKVCPTRHGRRTRYKLYSSNGSLTSLKKMPKRARARRR